MIILIGGTSCAGKTLMAQRLLEKYKYPYLSIDHLKMGLFRADNNCGFTPEDGFELIGEKLWPILKGMIMTAVENNQNMIIEGCYLLPERIAELGAEYLEDIISFYMVFSKAYIERFYLSKIIYNQSAIETREEAPEEPTAWYIRENERMREMYARHSARFFEIDGEYESETAVIYEWLDGEIAKKT